MGRNMFLSCRAERLFFQIPICIAVAFGLSLMFPSSFWSSKRAFSKVLLAGRASCSWRSWSVPCR